MSLDAKIRFELVSLFYGAFEALKQVNMTMAERQITALIGPSGCGKSTLLRTLNRMNDLIPGVRITGLVRVDGRNIYAPGTDVTTLRKRIGMVFQRPNPFPLSVRDNVSFGLRVAGLTSRADVEPILERSLRAAWLWDQVKDRLDQSALDLPLDQQQRLCIARLLAVEPDIILMDEPCSALDPIATGKVEDLMLELKKQYTIVIVTHNMQQAARISDVTGYMLLGDMIESGATAALFTNPQDRRTQDYLSGRYG
ncbi:MAG: phosphate ABC transporter ATP-binding protein PstB [Kiritimatiellaeota bacterium]|nr:phosphate ABC transporter ATP-binding protein PstB [Kiritimatiellota bacterium]